MNCKQGDLAYIFRCDSYPPNVGMSVTCIRLITGVERDGYEMKTDVGPIWYVGRMIKWTSDFDGEKVEFPCVPDALLRPITPDPDLIKVEREKAVPV